MKPIDILVKHNLKRTSCREGIIELIMKSKNALSENEIRERLQGNYDRTTFYRSFKTLEAHNILHKIVVDNNIVKYALNNTIKHKHAHFYCNKCNTVQCLDSVKLEMPELPAGFNGTEIDLVIKGICDSCKQNLTEK